MRYDKLINESFRTAQEKFVDQSNDETLVKDYLDIFKELARKNIVKGDEKDISRWIKTGWDEFKQFVDKIKDNTSNRQQKHTIKKDVIKLIDNETMTVIIPLTEKASCYYGKQTKWCTAATESDNAFYVYILNNKTLVYVLIGDRKVAANIDMNNNKISYFNASDDTIQEQDFKSITGIGEDQLYKWAKQYEGAMVEARQRALVDIIALLSTISENDIKLSKKGFMFNGYVEFFSIPKIDPQLLALSEFMESNPDSFDDHKDKIYPALEHVLSVIKNFTDDTEHLYVPQIEYGIGEYLSSVYPPFNKFMMLLVSRHYKYLNDTKVKEINTIDDAKEKEKAMFEYKKGIEKLLSTITKLKQ